MGEQPTSINFDRAADYYDRTRALSPPAMQRVVELLRAELAGEGPCLEIGIGTGRIAIPLFRSGMEIAGVDISQAMLDRLAANAGGRVPFPLARADATRLPFAEDSFGSALTSHVLHLISSWREVLAEVARVVRPGGILLNNLGGWRDARGGWVELQERFAEEVGSDLKHIGADDANEVDAAMADFGAVARRLEPVVNSRVVSLRDQLTGLADGRWSFTWRVDEEVRRAAVARLTPWAEKRFGSQLELGADVRWTAYHFEA
ncbi:MAG: class I SAM-dependent methyltransferase [Actinomycetota bacterium]